MRNVPEIYREYSVHQLQMRYQRNAVVWKNSSKKWIEPIYFAMQICFQNFNIFEILNIHVLLEATGGKSAAKSDT